MEQDMAEENTQAGQPGQATRRSDVYDNFIFTDAQGKDKAQCKRCRLVFSGNTKSGTSNLWRHLKKCKGQVGESTSSSSQPQPQPSGPEEEASTDLARIIAAREPAAGPEEEASMDLARMIALDGCDPSVVEGDYFRSFVRRLNPGFKVPSRLSIEEMCDGIFDEKRKDLFSRLSDVQRRGKVSLKVGTTKSIIDGEILYTSCHFIDDEWNLHKMVMNVYVLTSFDRRGPLLGVPVIELEDMDSCIDFWDDLKGRGILDTLFMMTEAIDVLSSTAIEKIISDTYAKDRGFVCDSMDNLLHSIARFIAPNFDLQKDLFHQVDDMNLTRQKRQRYLSQLDLDNLWEYDRFWFSWYCSLRVLHEGGQSISADQCSSCTQLFFKLSREMYHAIQRLSASSGPTSNLCIVLLFNIREVILQSRGDQANAHDGCNVFVGARLRAAKNKLDKVIQDSYLIWCIPLVLDPRYKLTYIKFIFKRAFEPDAADNYISEVTRKLEELYTDYVQDGGTAVMVATGSAYLQLQQAWDEVRQTEATRTELDRYLNDSVVIPPAQDFDILKWWKDNSRNYPAVARMARDALAMPTCSKLSSDQIAQVRSLVRGYSKQPYRHAGGRSSSSSS